MAPKNEYQKHVYLKRWTACSNYNKHRDRITEYGETKLVWPEIVA